MQPATTAKKHDQLGTLKAGEITGAVIAYLTKHSYQRKKLVKSR